MALSSKNINIQYCKSSISFQRNIYSNLDRITAREFVVQNRLKGQIDSALNMLDRHPLDAVRRNGRKILELRFGLVDGIERTREQIAKIFGYKTKEGVRQVELTALSILRKSGILKKSN